MIKVQICLFAYNLEESIASCIESVMENCGSYPYEVFVMINGCTDQTYDIVSRLADTHPSIHPVLIEIGDKSNAWNTFIYQYYDGHSVAVFADGDLTFGQNAFQHIVDCHLAQPHYNAISGFPCDQGRSSKQMQHRMQQNHDLAGGLYLLSPLFIQTLTSHHVKLPVGLIGDDSMLGFLSATNLCSGTDLPKQRIGVCVKAVFIYAHLSLLRWQDYKLYFRRRVRYSLRYFQQLSIVSDLKQQGISAMPAVAIHGTSASLHQVRWRSSHLIFDLISKWRIDRQKMRLHPDSENTSKSLS
ncbi:glycosyltransferase family 2 protein [Photobacterium sp. WH24]|uniref:glycosyltransferase family A protein n=1 Tax=Photobacterium sp. WH24 TaxID=2827237 RepID=UPI001C486BE3|nr:glycosyltransferase family A protein [Photobacterium sp. WH24]MBV7262794.1 glycosyltransferase family 2 protein [Photobacterium sp. WH24]